MISELELRTRFPEIPWDQPVLVHIAGDRTEAAYWVCRYCIAMYGLRAQELVQADEYEYAFPQRPRVLAHIERAHHE